MTLTADTDSASDAYAAVQLFSVLEGKRESLRPTPPRPAFAELGLPIRLADGVTAMQPAAEAEADEDRGAVPANKAKRVKKASSTTSTPKRKTAVIPAGSKSKSKTAGISAASTPKKSKTAVLGAASSRRPKDARIAAADEWLAQYLLRAEDQGQDRQQAKRAPRSSLRAYHLWHRDETLDPAAVASLLRDPPLLTTTVVGYILDAVRHEDLPYDRARLRAELLEQLPAGVVMLRYRQLARTCGFGGRTW